MKAKWEAVKAWCNAKWTAAKAWFANVRF
jgi:hypothetical protein